MQALKGIVSLGGEKVVVFGVKRLIAIRAIGDKQLAEVYELDQQGSQIPDWSRLFDRQNGFLLVVPFNKRLYEVVGNEKCILDLKEIN
jgi:hypothetical protein